MAQAAVEAKGLFSPARTAVRELRAWAAAPVDLDPERSAKVLAEAPSADPDAPVAGPVLCAGTFTAPDAVDHFLRLDGWTTGLVWVNGVLLGRYSATGPTRTLNGPGPLVRAGENGVIVLELQAAATARVRFVGAADVGPTES